ncbi:hypothetical protein Bca101_026316 [Brassica carinata]
MDFPSIGDTRTNLVPWLSHTTITFHYHKLISRQVKNCLQQGTRLVLVSPLDGKVMTLVDLWSLDYHPSPSPSVHASPPCSLAQRPLLSSFLLGAISLDSLHDEQDEKAHAQGALDEVREASPYTSASNESLHQLEHEKGPETRNPRQASTFFFLNELNSAGSVFKGLI